MIKLSASYTAKVPGQQDYSSNCASASIEIDLADSEGHNAEAKLDELWSMLKQAVDQQLAQGGNQTGSPAPQDNRPQPSSATQAPNRFANNGQSQPQGRPSTTSGDGATRKQIGFLLGCARRQFDWSAEQTKAWVQQDWGKDLNTLTKAEAAQIIDSIQAQAA